MIFKEVLSLVREYSDRTGILHLVAFYSDEDGFVFRDRPREEDPPYDFSKRILLSFENLRDARKQLKEELKDLEEWQNGQIVPTLSRAY